MGKQKTGWGGRGGWGGNRVPSPLQNLIKSSSFLITGDKATGVSGGSNAPFTNPWKDLKKVADVTLQGFAGTLSDGWVDVLCPNGLTKKFLKFDGVDSLGIANHPNLDIVGTGDFAIGVVFKTDAALPTSTLFCKGDGVNNPDLILFSIGANLVCRVARNYFVLASSTLLVNTLYKVLFYRTGGRLKCRLLNVVVYDQLNNLNILTAPLQRIGARPTNAGGTTHGDFTNTAIGTLDIINGAITPFTEADLIKKWDAYCKSVYGL